MKFRMVILGASMALLALGPPMLMACTPGERQIAKDAIDVTTAVCAIQHFDDPNVNAFCNVVESKADQVKKLIGAQRDVVAKVRVDFAAQRTTPCDGKR